MFRKTIILFYVVFFLLPMASAEDMKNDEFTLQISGQRDGEGYDVNFYITSEKVVVFFHKPTEEKKYFDCNYIYNFTKKN